MEDLILNLTHKECRLQIELLIWVLPFDISTSIRKTKIKSGGVWISNGITHWAIPDIFHTPSPKMTMVIQWDFPWLFFMNHNGISRALSYRVIFGAV